jgi:LysM repeat protein
VPTEVTGFDYVVQRGDNYYRIAQRFGVSLSLLLQVNHVVNPSILFVGSVVLIPSDNPPPDNGGSVPVGDNNTPEPTVAPPPPPEPTQVPGFNYVVQRGDNYFSIAQRFGVSLSTLLAVNHVINPQILYVGAVLLIPSDNPPPDNGGTTPADTPTPEPIVAPTATTSPADLPGAFAYVVQRGDNLFRLSLRFGVSVDRIKQLNGLVSNVIYIGQTLIIAP